MKTLRILFLVALSCPVAAQVSIEFQPSRARLRVGDEYRLLFVTSTTRDPSSSDIEVYNDFVQAAADAAPVVGSWGLEWKVIASTDDIAARDNTNTNPSIDIGVPIYRLDGRPIWLDNVHLWGLEGEGGGRLPFYTPNITELGTLYTEPVSPFPYAAVWTGTSFDGTTSPKDNRPLTLGSNVVSVGTANLLGQPIRARLTNEVQLELPFYAISEVITVVPEPEYPAAVLLILLYVVRTNRFRSGGTKSSITAPAAASAA